MAETLYEEARVELLKGNLEAAEKLSTDGLLMSRRLNEDDRVEAVLVKALFQQARVMHAKGDFDGSLKNCEECLEIRQRLFGSEAEHSSIAESLHLLATAQFELALMTEAIGNAERSVGIV